MPLPRSLRRRILLITMSKKLTFALLFVPVLAFAANPATLETRSTRHSFVIDVVPVGNAVQYIARVTDLATGELLVSAGLGPGVTNAESYDEKRGHQIRINLRPSLNGLSASVTIEKNGMLIDSMESRWSLNPTPSHSVPPRGDALRVGGDVKAPVIVSKVEPVYPEEARAARVSGIVILEVVIDKTGSVRDAVVLKPLPFGMDKAAIDAVKQWKFKPGTLNGMPVDVIFNLTVNFKLN